MKWSCATLNSPWYTYMKSSTPVKLVRLLPILKSSELSCLFLFRIVRNEEQADIIRARQTDKYNEYVVFVKDLSRKGAQHSFVC